MNKIYELRKIKSLTQAELGKAIGVGQNTISSYEKGTRQPDITTLKKLAEYFGVTVDELLNEKAEAPVKLPPSNVVTSPHARYVPLIDSVRCGMPAPTDWVGDEKVQVSDELYERWGTSLFAYRAQGSSMEPRICSGDTLIFSYDAPWQDGDICLVWVDDGATVKRVSKASDGTITLIPLNPDFDPLAYPPQKAERYGLTVIAKLVASYRQF